MADVLMNSEAIDEKISLAQELLSNGKDKYQVAREVGYKDASGLDKYAKRLGYVWNRNIKNYELKDDTELVVCPSKKVAKILSMIKIGSSIESIVKYFRMENSQALADYMRKKGYEWTSEKGTYIRRNMILYSEDEEREQNDDIYKSSEDEDIDIMKLLESNKGKLIELLAFKPKNTIPRYLLKGMPVTKGFFISVEIDRLIKDFSREKNISQKDIIQTVLIEFFNKYGFSNEVDMLLKS